jgi:arylsulfatase A-like enzyme
MSARRPNVLIVYPDQWRGDALGCAGDPVVQTPHLDRLAWEGLRFTHAFVANPVCTPSRGSFMTGCYPHTTGITHNQAPLPDDEVCFAEALTAAGYHTGYIGKWHLDGEARPGFVPPERRHGWQYWAAFNRGHRYYDGVYFRDTPEVLPEPGFEPDFQTDLALAFLEDAARGDRPFCLLLAWGPPHTPLEPPARQRDTYQPADLPLPASVPDVLADRARDERARYFGLCTALDDNVGRLLAALDRLGLAEDTIVLFTSDHGDCLGEHGRFRKTLPYDEAARVPCIVRWPGRVPAGTATGALWHSVDVAPTLLSLCSAAIPPRVQGLDLSAVVRQGGAGPRESAYIAGHIANPPDAAGLPEHALPDDWRALRTADALIATDLAGQVAVLFDLRRDPLALENLAGQPAGRVLEADLLARLRVEARRLGDAVPLAE